MKLLFIHGRAQQGKNPILLKNIWVDTLIEGLDSIGLNLPINTENILLPYYGDLLHELTTSFSSSIKDVIEKGSTSTKDKEFFMEFLLDITSNSTIDVDSIGSHLEDQIIEKGPSNWSWVQAILSAIDSNTNWGDAAIKRFTFDVYLYLTYTAVKARIESIIEANLLEDEEYVVVGHSLGSIIGYNILREKKNIKVIKYITLGSPLGISAVKKRLKTPLKMPPCIEKGWLNAYDDRDIVALNSLDKSNFNITSEINNISDVDNKTDNRHGIIGYLNDKRVAKIIYESVKNGST